MTKKLVYYASDDFKDLNPAEVSDLIDEWRDSDTSLTAYQDRLLLALQVYLLDIRKKDLIRTISVFN